MFLADLCWNENDEISKNQANGEESSDHHDSGEPNGHALKEVHENLVHGKGNSEVALPLVMVDVLAGTPDVTSWRYTIRRLVFFATSSWSS